MAPLPQESYQTRPLGLLSLHTSFLPSFSSVSRSFLTRHHHPGCGGRDFALLCSVLPPQCLAGLVLSTHVWGHCRKDRDPVLNCVLQLLAAFLDPDDVVPSFSPNDLSHVASYESFESAGQIFRVAN